VWLEEQQLVFRRRQVRIGLEGRGLAQIREGLKTGEAVVARGAIFVNNEWRTQ
jgi:cobalt-zinc-cadmium efflux system membrane fusion protein